MIYTTAPAGVKFL